MVKRCSASRCFNSQLTHNKISYFGYPKNEEIAREWARRAGRDDLLDKKLENLTKYYICSDHFARDAFQNPDVGDKAFLKLNKTYCIPLPSIFEDNLMENVKSVTENKEKFVNYTKHVISETTAKPESTNFPRQSLKKESLKQENYPEDLIEYTENDECVYVEEFLEVSRTDEDFKKEPEDINSYCRLCATNENVLFPLFNENGDYNIETECLKLMPPGLIVKDDGLPQYACIGCLEKLESCANIVDGFVSNQNLF